jgi:hypothetical protein
MQVSYFLIFCRFCRKYIFTVYNGSFVAVLPTHVTDTITTLYGTVGMTMNQTLPEEYLSVLQAESVDDNTLLHIKNTHEGTSLNPGGGRKGAAAGGTTGAGGAAGATSNAAKLSKLHAALSAKLYLLVW